ncbi:MAG: hypothetical protein MI924_33870 [Chloroflexales bacterium]|nr:hypothetical protein [Chloroflexales bacterium]
MDPGLGAARYCDGTAGIPFELNEAVDSQLAHLFERCFMIVAVRTDTGRPDELVTVMPAFCSDCTALL